MPSPGRGSLRTNPGVKFVSGYNGRDVCSKRYGMNWENRITVDPNILVGKPVIKGTRIAVEFVVDLLARGWSVEKVLREYDHISAEDVQACLAYASEVLKSERLYLTPAN